MPLDHDHEEELDANRTSYASASPWYVPGYQDEIRAWRGNALQGVDPPLLRMIKRLQAGLGRLLGRDARDMAMRIPPQRTALDGRVPASDRAEVARPDRH